MSSIAGVRGAVAIGLVAATVMASPASAHSPEWNKERRHIRERGHDLVGSPYSYGGSTPSGFDCSGFTRWTFRNHGAALPHSSMAQFNLGKRKGYKRIWNRANLEVGDLVFHKTTGAPVGHVGVFIGNGRFISSTSSDGVQVRSLYDPYYWGSRWVGATRLPATVRFKGV